MRTRIKICGITNLEDAQAAVEYGADALGFIFVPDTPRYVGNNTALLSRVHTIPPFVNRVAVCTEPAQVMGEWENDFDTVQFYATGWYAEGIALQQWIYAHRVKDEASLNAIVEASKQDRSSPLKTSGALLLDTYHKDKLGGVGETFNWQIAVEAKRRFELPIILAGGLTPENVGEAVRTVRPYAVDVSSGVEASPRRKNHAKIKAFIDAVRQADIE